MYHVHARRKYGVLMFIPGPGFDWPCDTRTSGYGMRRQVTVLYIFL